MDTCWCMIFSCCISLHLSSLWMAMLLLSTRILARLSTKTTVLRDWRVVNIPSEHSRSIDVGTLFSRIIQHVYDPLEPFLPTPADSTASITAAIGGSQQGDFQDLPLCVCVADAVQFGVYMKFFIIREDPTVAVVSSNIRNAAEVLMASARDKSHLPTQPSNKAVERSRRFALKRDVLLWLRDKGLGWSRDSAESTGAQFVAALTEILWTLDGHSATFSSRACPIPQEFESFTGYNQPSASKHRKRDAENLSAAVLDSHSSLLNEFALHPWLNSTPWKPVRAAVCALADSLYKYAEYLKHKNVEVQENHDKLAPIRSPNDAECYTFIQKSIWRKPAIEARFKPLQSTLDREEQFVPVFVNDLAPANQRKRRYFIDNLKSGQCLTCDSVLFDYATGNCLGTIHFIWKVPDSCSAASLTAGNAECFRKIQPSLPIYHTRAMKKHFFEQISLLQCGKPSALRGIYRLLTGDMSSSENLNEAQVDERISTIINTQDPSIVDDLRHHNRGHPTKYERFWEECKKYLEDETAVDDRRHGEHTHLAKAISSRDLLEEVSKRCPEGTPIPSKQWLRLQFWPKNPTNKTALQYTGKLNVKFMIQLRQLRKNHEDSHYCAAIFCYLKEFTIRFRNYCSLFFMDDKHKCKVGEPGLPVAAVERGKKVVVSTGGKQFAVADHDFTKFSIIPSVVVVCDIPESIDDSFYRGQVLVGLKDSALEASSPLRHCTELSKILQQRQIDSPIMVFYTDEGPDHNNTFLSVQLSFIALFLHYDLDMLEAVRTAPYQSWKNPCERVNCILNLGLQAVGLMRAGMEQKFETAISNCNSLKEIRDTVTKTPGLDEALKDSLEPVKVLLHSIFSRLSLKDKPFSSYSSASEHEMEAFFSVMEELDPTVTRGDRSKDCLPQRPALKTFMEHCCYQRKYVFGIKKCGKQDCTVCRPPRLAAEVFNELHHLPDPVPENSLYYKSFSDLYGTLTTEQHRPTLKNKSASSSHGIPFNPNAQTARELIMCSECLKPRVIYSQRKLSIVDERVLSRTIENLLYSCGSVLQGLEVEVRPGEDPAVLTLFDRVFVRQNLTCDKPIEVPYYSSERFAMICTCCGCTSDAQEGQYPLCGYCKSKGNVPILKRKRKMFTGPS